MTQQQAMMKLVSDWFSMQGYFTDEISVEQMSCILTTLNVAHTVHHISRPWDMWTIVPFVPVGM